MPKGPFDRIDELTAKAARLRADIKAGKSGDGKTSPDLKAQLQIVEQELRTLLSANPDYRASKMYPNSKHN